MNSRKYLRLSEVAEYARVSPSTVRHWILTKKLPSVRPGKLRLVAQVELDAFMQGSAKR